MSKANNARRAKSVAENDLVGSYGGDFVVIQGLVSPESQCSWTGEDGYDTHCFTLAAWRLVGEPVVTRELYVQRPIRKGSGWPGVFEKHTVHRMEVLLSKDHTRAAFSRRLKMTEPDQELADVALELLQTVVLATDEFGEFTLDRSFNRFEGRSRWIQNDVSIWLPGPTAVLVKGGRELAKVERALQTLLKIWTAKKTWDRKCKQLIVQELLPIKNKYWLDEGERPLRNKELAARLELTSIWVDSARRIEFWYDVGETFTDHEIRVRATLKNGPRTATIEG